MIYFKGYLQVYNGSEQETPSEHNYDTLSSGGMQDHHEIPSTSTHQYDLNLPQMENVSDL